MTYEEFIISTFYINSKFFDLAHKQAIQENANPFCSMQRAWYNKDLLTRLGTENLCTILCDVWMGHIYENMDVDGWILDVGIEDDGLGLGFLLPSFCKGWGNFGHFLDIG